MEILLFIIFVCFLALVASSLMSNQLKNIRSSKRIERKLDKIIELLDKEENNK